MACKLSQEEVGNLAELFHVQTPNVSEGQQRTMCAEFEGLLHQLYGNLRAHKGRNCFGGWTVDQVLGAGKFGTVLSAHNGSGRRMAFKVVVDDEYYHSPRTPDEEVVAQQAFAKVGLAPPVLCHEMLTLQDYAKIHIIAMDVVPSPDADTARQPAVILRKFLDLMTHMRASGFTHGDPHYGNIIPNARRQGATNFSFSLVDFGWASEQVYFPYLDAAQFLYSSRDMLDHETFDMFVSHVNAFLTDPDTVRRAIPLPKGISLPINGRKSQRENMYHYYEDLMDEARDGHPPYDPSYVYEDPSSHRPDLSIPNMGGISHHASQGLVTGFDSPQGMSTGFTPSAHHGIHTGLTPHANIQLPVPMLHEENFPMHYQGEDDFPMGTLIAPTVVFPMYS